MDPTAVALEVPATRRSVRRRVLIVSALTVVALGLLVLGVVQLGRVRAADDLQRDGATATATITGVESRRVGPRGQYVDGSVTIDYDVDGQHRERSVDVGADVADLHEGDTVAIVYDPAHPADATIVDRTPQVSGVPVVVLFAFAAIIGAMALVAGRHVRQLRRAVLHDPWLFVRSRMVQAPLARGSRLGSRTFVILETPRGEIAVEPSGLNRVDPTFAPDAWVAGLDQVTMALAPPGGGHVVAVRRRSAPDPHVGEPEGPPVTPRSRRPDR